MGKHTEIWNEIFYKGFSKESDRAAVILTASLFDTSLDNLLRSYLVAISTSEDELFDGPNAPIATFSSKILMAHRLGLISTEFARDLHLIRKIRNHFAHNVQGCDFSQPQVAQQVSQLCNSSKMTEKSPEIRKSFGDQGMRGDFMMVCSWMLWYLNDAAESLEPLTSCRAEIHYTEHFASNDSKKTKTTPSPGKENPKIFPSVPETEK